MNAINDDIESVNDKIKYIFRRNIYLRLESKVLKLRVLEIRYSKKEDGSIKNELLCKELVGDDLYLLDMLYYQVSFTDEYQRIYRILYYSQGDLFEKETPVNDKMVEVKCFYPIEQASEKLEAKMNGVLKKQQEHRNLTKEGSIFNLY